MALGVGSIGAADALLSPGDKIVAVGGSLINQSSYPAAETPGYAVDQNFSTKYLFNKILKFWKTQYRFYSNPYLGSINH